MAIVRITAKLRDDILHAANNTFEKRIKQAETLPADLGDRAYAAWLADGNGDVIAAVEAAGQSSTWLKQSDTIIIDYIGTKHINHTLQLSTPRTFPGGGHYYYVYNNVKLSETSGEEISKIILASRHAQAELVQQRSVFARKVGALLDAHKTLKQALEVWPQLWELVPQWAKDLHNQKVERTKREKSAVDVDVDDLNVVLVTSKLVDAL